MKKIIAVAFMLVFIISCNQKNESAAFAQNSKTEKEILKLNSELDEALVKRNIAYFERIYADDYVSYNPDGTVKNRLQSLEDMRKRFEDSTGKNLERTIKSDSVKVRTSGNLAVVTAKWTNTWKNTKDTIVPTHIDREYYTAVFEKRGGKWLLVSEHATEMEHDKAQTEAEILYANREFDLAFEKKNREALSRVFADEYIFTHQDSRSNKEQLIPFLLSPDDKTVGAKTEDRQFRVLNNYAAVETSKLTLVQKENGKRKNETNYVTVVWMYRDGRWQAIAEHWSK